MTRAFGAAVIPEAVFAFRRDGEHGGPCMSASGIAVVERVRGGRGSRGYGREESTGASGGSTGRWSVVVTSFGDGSAEAALANNLVRGIKKRKIRQNNHSMKMMDQLACHARRLHG